MRINFVLPLFLFLCQSVMGAPQDMPKKSMGLEDVRALIHQNRAIVIENLNKQIAYENLKQQKSERLPELGIEGTGYLDHDMPITEEMKGSNSLLYHFNIGTSFDLYAGGKHKYAIRQMAKEQAMSEERQLEVRNQAQLKAFILLYDIHRNITYREFIRSSIHLREKEYERIEQLYQNGLVLKSDLLRSKLYITDLQKDEVSIANSIDILSDELSVLLGMEESFAIQPALEGDLSYKLDESFEELFLYALAHSPSLKIHRIHQEQADIALKEIRSAQIPNLKFYAQYGVGSALPVSTYDHRLGAEVGLKLNISLSSLYKSKHRQKAQQQRILQEQVMLNNEEEMLKNRLYELYTRYRESLLNIDRALEKINMSKETTRILTNSYFNQQALLIDVLESETKSMEASFEWVEAIVDSQKYYWALKEICGYNL